MSLSQSLSQQAASKAVNNFNIIEGEILEKVILENDVSKLSPIEKVKYVNNVCLSLSLNPLTRPIQIHKFNGKEVLYVSKDGGEQLRKLHNVSIVSLETKIMDGVYIVTAKAKTPNNREDSATGVVTIGGLKGDALANAMMKTETKAKRRVTLSICGLGFMDESELDTLPNAQKVELQEPANAPINNTSDKFIMDDVLYAISTAETKEELEEIYRKYYKELAINKDNVNLRKLIEAKDKRKFYLTVEEKRNELNTVDVEVETEK